MKKTAAEILEKPILSTGELAQICHVTKHTIISAIDKGELRASQTPGGHNRIRREDALQFMKRFNFEPALERKRILVVDDEGFIREIMEEVFSGQEFMIFHAENGYQAGMLAERERPDLILLDILLPDIDGRDVCRHIRGEDYGKSCKILAVTALRSPEDVKAIYEAGIDGYIAKPFKIDELRSKVEDALSVEVH